LPDAIPTRPEIAWRIWFAAIPVDGFDAPGQAPTRYSGAMKTACAVREGSPSHVQRRHCAIDLNSLPAGMAPCRDQYQRRLDL